MDMNLYYAFILCPCLFIEGNTMGYIREMKEI